MDSYGQRKGRLPDSSEQKINFSTGTIAVLAGVLILGVGIGSAITSTTAVSYTHLTLPTIAIV